MNPSELWTDYVITNHRSGKTYRVALRGWERGESYCSCPDYRVNTLGTCKHIMCTLNHVKNKFLQEINETPYQIQQICVYLHYGEKIEARLLVPEGLPEFVLNILEPMQGVSIHDVRDLKPFPGILLFSMKVSGSRIGKPKPAGLSRD